MSVRIVQSKQNERLKELRRALRDDGTGASGLVAIEGPNLLAEAQRAGLALVRVFVAQESTHLLDPLSPGPKTEVLLVPRDLLCSTLATETPQPIAALVEPPAWAWENLLCSHPSNAPLLLVLCGLQDPGNVGTILRSAEAFGSAGVVALPGTVSVWNQKAVRASAGSVFRVPVVRASLDECFSRMQREGVKAWAAAVRNAKPVADVALDRPVALLIGNEGNGVPAEVMAKVDGAITIPCPGPVESLNAAVATSILLYEAARQRAEAAQASHNARASRG